MWHHKYFNNSMLLLHVNQTQLNLSKRDVVHWLFVYIGIWENIQRHFCIMGEASIQIGSEGWPKNHISVVRQELNYDKTNNCINSGSVELIVLKWPKFKELWLLTD